MIDIHLSVDYKLLKVQEERARDEGLKTMPVTYCGMTFEEVGEETDWHITSVLTGKLSEVTCDACLLIKMSVDQELHMRSMEDER